MYFFKLIGRHLYNLFIEQGRYIFNRIIYFIIDVYIKFFNVSSLKVYSDSNGWFVTYKYKNYIYKIIGPFVFLRINFSMFNLRDNLKELHKKLLKNNYEQVTPFFYINLFYVKFEFIENCISLDNYIVNIENSNEKIKFFIKLFDRLEEFHTLGFTHGDLKPKNILVSNNIHFIDLENIKKILDSDSKIQDYDKLIPKIIYYLNLDELDCILSIIKSESIKKYIQNRYLLKYDIVERLKKFSFIEFEKDSYTDNEDIDIEVPTIKEFYEIINDFKKTNLDMIVYYCCINDMKLYLYNQLTFNVIDIHIKTFISNVELFYLKLFKNNVINVFITGPDGIGKSTVLDNLINNKNKFFYKMFNLKKRHANRFIQQESIVYNSKLERFVFCKPFGCILKKNLILLKYKIFTKSIVNVFDRSFIDVYIHNELNYVNKILIHLFGHKTDIILLCDNSKNILERKQELSSEKIDNYYNNFRYFEEDIYMIDVKSIEITTYKLNSILKHKILTRV